MRDPWIEQRYLALYCTESRHVDGWKQEEGLKSHWGGSDDGVGASEADPTGKLLQQAGDGSRGALRWRLEAHGGAVGCQEDFPHCLQTGLALRGEGKPGEGRGGGGHKRVLDEEAEG